MNPTTQICHTQSTANSALAGTDSPPLTKCPICTNPLNPLGKMWRCVRCSFEICLGCSESWLDE